MSEVSWLVLEVDQESAIQVMSTIEVKNLINKLEFSSILSLFVAKQVGDSVLNWTCVTEVDEFHDYIFYGDEAAENQKMERDRRLYPRFQSNLKVLLQHGDTYFTSITMDVSQGGLRLAHPVPGEMQGRRCQVQIDLNPYSTKPLSFYAIVTTTEFDETRVVFENSTNDSVFLEWLKNISMPSANAA